MNIYLKIVIMAFYLCVFVIDYSYLVMGDREELDDETETEHEKRKRRVS